MRTTDGLITVTIANGAAESNIVDIGGKTVCGVWLPAAITNTTVNFKASRTAALKDAGTVSPVKDKAGTAVGITGYSAGDYVALDPTYFAGLQYLQIFGVSNEAAERTFYLATREIA